MKLHMKLSVSSASRVSSIFNPWDFSFSPATREFDCRTLKWQQDLKQLGPWMSLNVLDNLQLHHQTWCKCLVGIRRSMVCRTIQHSYFHFQVDIRILRLNESNHAQVCVSPCTSFDNYSICIEAEAMPLQSQDEQIESAKEKPAASVQDQLHGIELKTRRNT